MTAHPIDLVLVNNEDVDKPEFSSFVKGRLRLHFIDADEVRSTSLTGHYAGLYIANLIDLFDLDTEDTTTADDGETCIIDADGNRFKSVTTQDASIIADAIESILAGEENFTGAITFENSVTVQGAISVQGNVTLGGSSSDSITINAGTTTLASNNIISRDLGSADGGNINPITYHVTFSGNSDTTTDVRGLWLDIIASGSNAISKIYGTYSGILYQSSANLTIGYLHHAYCKVGDAGNIADTRIFYAHHWITSTGGISGTAVNYEAGTLVNSGSGTIASAKGFLCSNIGHATLVNTVRCFEASAQSASGTVQAFFHNIASGTNKWGFYGAGTADNFFEGRIKHGATSISANGTGTVTVGNLAPGTTAVSIKKWKKELDSSGTEYLSPMFGA